MKLVTVSQMQAIEKEADSKGLTYDQMMQNAGHGLADVVADLFIDDDQLEIVGLVGPGNNGGDALVALTALAEEGCKASAYLVKRKKDDLVKQFVDVGGNIFSGDDAFDQLAESLETADVLFDGVLGTGIKLPLKKEVAELLSEVNDLLDSLDESPLVIAVDCPSGVDCDSGEVADETIHADLTVTMAAVKQGLLKLPAFEYIGELKVVDIGLPVDLPSLKNLQTEVADEDSVSALRRSARSILTKGHLVRRSSWRAPSTTPGQSSLRQRRHIARERDWSNWRSPRPFTRQSQVRFLRRRGSCSRIPLA